MGRRGSATCAVHLPQLLDRLSHIDCSVIDPLEYSSGLFVLHKRQQQLGELKQFG